MSRVFGAFSAAVLSTMIGCGGFGASNSPFAGTWAGYIQESGGSNPTANLTISGQGAITGSEQVPGDPVAIYNLTGQVQASGQFKMTGQLQGQPDQVFQGTMTPNSGYLKGSGVMTVNSTQMTVTFNLGGSTIGTSTGIGQ